ncbi:hypothetical protein [Capnocytophaga sp.]|uniref:hypothetical protein n=1 Tax=Capnocytophaga sp. TaxID=44737 RepID=UPI0026DBF086|nr:hypothetical protein [Capnocytophaga sp.]MDO5106560.1 hypothetical protein [Capnocytophaga sp.]
MNKLTETEYAQSLDELRYLFAWVLIRYGKFSPEKARIETLTKFPYESDNQPFRDLIFHEEAWHWAMLFLHGEGYWEAFPQYVQIPDDYRKTEDLLFQKQLKFSDLF